MTFRAAAAPDLIGGFKPRYGPEEAQLLEDEGGGQLLVPLQGPSLPGAAEQGHVEGPQRFLRHWEGEETSQAVRRAFQRLPILL